MILALDSSTLTLSLAVGRPGEPAPLASARHGPPSKMSELLPGAVLDLLAGVGLTLDDVQGLVVGLGPGSFTGLRIGLATVKGFAYARRLPVAGASSLAALALECPEDTPLAAVAVARRGELYVGRYSPVGHARPGARPRGGLHRGGARHGGSRPSRPPGSSVRRCTRPPRRSAPPGCRPRACS